jgi:hypothetical protein
LPSPHSIATDQDIIVELTRLSVSLPHAGNPTKEDVALRLAAMCDDLRGRTLEDIRGGCRKFQQGPKNRFFPSPGQLLDAMKNPYSDPPSARRPFFQADDSFRLKAEAERAEVDDWFRKKCVANDPR